MAKYREKLSSLDTFQELESFSAGRSFRAWRCFGAHPAQDASGVQGCLFRTWAPNAAGVAVVGDFNQWDPDVTPMTAGPNGIWEAS